jgi:integrase/recombinase XerD
VWSRAFGRDRGIGRSEQPTEEGSGEAVSLRIFRDAAATTLAIEDPQHVRLATPLLGHRHSGTTERHYQQAQALEAHREFVDVVGKANNAVRGR